MVASMFTTSPDEHFILDRDPAMDDPFIAAGFSGHGYKFCSVIGRVMADFCFGEERKWGWRGVLLDASTHIGDPLLVSVARGVHILMPVDS